MCYTGSRKEWEDRQTGSFHIAWTNVLWGSEGIDVREADTGEFDCRRGMCMPLIEFLFWQDCPSYPEALERLRKVVAEVGDHSPIELIEVLAEDDAERLSFPGSPTIRVDGDDVDPSGAEQMGAALTCRIYRLEDGRFSPLPSEEMIRRALA